MLCCGLLLVGTASVNAQTNQTKPPELSAYYGTWKGSWSNGQFSGGAVVEISQIGPEFSTVAGVQMTPYNAVVPGFSVMAQYINGELIFEGDRHNPKLTFKLEGRDKLQIFSNIGSGGRYQLARAL